MSREADEGLGLHPGFGAPRTAPPLRPCASPGRDEPPSAVSLSCSLGLAGGTGQSQAGAQLGSPHKPLCCHLS